MVKKGKLGQYRNVTSYLEISSMWSILWNGFHIWKLFKSCWIKSCYMPPTTRRSAPNETGPLWCATRCGNISAGLELRASEERDRQGYSRHLQTGAQPDAEARGWESEAMWPRSIARGQIARGDVRLYQFAAGDKTKDKKRPALVLTRNSAIAYLSTVTVAPVTSTIRGVPSEVVLNEEDGMKSPCAVNLHNAVTVSQQRLGRRVAQLSSARMNEVCAALRFSLGCDSN